MDISFSVGLYQVNPKTLSAKDVKSIIENCTHVAGDVFILEGEIWAVVSDSVEWEEFGIFEAPSLGDLSPAEIWQIVKDKTGLSIGLKENAGERGDHPIWRHWPTGGE